MIKFEVNQRSGKKVEKRWVGKILKTVLKQTKIKNAEISIAIVGDAEMKRLNREWRGKNKVTDVLSFDYSRSGKTLKTTLKDAEIVGEIIICYSQAKRQAGECGNGVEQEIKMLLVHGLLHLRGYEHEGGGKEEERMRRREQRLLNQK